MKFTILCTCAVISAGVYLAAEHFQFLLAPIKIFYYYLIPILVAILLTASKKLELTNEKNINFNIKRVTKTKYFIRIMFLQILFYITTFWLFAGYIYQTNINCYLRPFAITDMVDLLQLDPLLYTFLPFTACASCGIGLLYFVTKHKTSPFLTECIFHSPKKMPWLFIHNVMIEAEWIANLMVLYLIVVFLLLELSNSLSLLIVNFAPISNPLLYSFLILPICSLKNYYKASIGWLVRKRFSFGLMLLLLTVVLFIALTLLVIFFAPFCLVLSNKTMAVLASKNKIFMPLSSKNFELLLIGWFFINMPRLGSIIGRFSYGLTIREAMLLNFLATICVGALLNLPTITAWQKLYALLIDPFWMFYSSLIILLLLWLYASDIKDKISLWAGPMFIFPSMHLKSRSIVGVMQGIYFVILIMLSGSGFIGWWLSQYFVTFIVIFLFPVYFGFAGMLCKRLVYDKIGKNRIIASNLFAIK